MGSPAETTDNVTKTHDRVERGIQRTNGVVDDVKAAAPGMVVHILLDRAAVTIDGRGAELFNRTALSSLVDGVHLRIKGPGDLDNHLANTAGSLNQDFLSFADPGPVDKTFPRRNYD